MVVVTHDAGSHCLPTGASVWLTPDRHTAWLSEDLFSEVPPNEAPEAPCVVCPDRGDRDRFGTAGCAGAADISAGGPALCGALVRDRQVSELVPAQVRGRYVRRLQPNAGRRAAGGQPVPSRERPDGPSDRCRTSDRRRFISQARGAFRPGLAFVLALRVGRLLDRRSRRRVRAGRRQRAQARVSVDPVAVDCRQRNSICRAARSPDRHGLGRRQARENDSRQALNRTAGKAASRHLRRRPCPTLIWLRLSTAGEFNPSAEQIDREPVAGRGTRRSQWLPPVMDVRRLFMLICEGWLPQDRFASRGCLRSRV